MCIYIYICTYIHVYTYAYNTYIYICICIHAYMHTCICVCVHMCVRVRVSSVAPRDTHSQIRRAPHAFSRTHIFPLPTPSLVYLSLWDTPVYPKLSNAIVIGTHPCYGHSQLLWALVIVMGTYHCYGCLSLLWALTIVIGTYITGTCKRYWCIPRHQLPRDDCHGH